MLPPSKAVTFREITRILELTDRFALNREWVEIPLAAESPGKVQKLPNGKIEIVVDADMPFEDWLGTVEEHLRELAGPANG